MKKIVPPFLVLILLGCNINDVDLDLDPPKFDGTYALPLGYVNYTMRELIEEIGDEALQLDEDSSSLLHFVYRDTASFNNGYQMIDVEDVGNSGTIFLLDSTNTSSNTISVRFDSTFTFSYPPTKNEQLDSVFYEDGELILNITKTFSHDLIYDITIENTRTISGNSPINFQGTVSQSSRSSEQDLSGYKTLLSYENGQNTFGFSVTLDVVLAPGEDISINDLIVFDLTYQGQTFDLLFGRFGLDTASVGDKVMNITFFEDLGESGLEFGAPEVTFSFENSYGIPLGVLFRGMYGINGDSTTADTTYLEGAITNSPQLVAAPATYTEIASSTIVLDKSNSSIQDLLATSPNKIGFDISAISNAFDADAANFLIDTSSLKTAIELYMPLELSLKNLTQEVDFDLGGGLGFDDADSISIRVVSNNGLPFSTSVEFEIRNDSADAILYSIPSTLVLETAFIDPTGMVSQPRKTIADVPVGKEGILALNEGGTLVMRFILNTPGNNSKNTFIKVLADYTIDMQVSLVGKINYQP